MAKSQKQKLAVDGTAKLAARATKAGDKHEKANLNIEEATVASPRETRTRTGYFHDFEDEDGDGGTAEPSSKPTDAPDSKSKKKAKTASSDKATKEQKKAKGKTNLGDAKIDETIGDKVKEDVEKPKKTKKAKTPKNDVDIGPSGDTAEVDDASATKKPSKKAKADRSGKEKEKAPNDKEEETIADRVVAEVAEAPKKSKPAKKDVVIGPSGDTAQVDVVESKPKKAKAAPKEKIEKAAKPKKATKEDTSGDVSKASGVSTKDPKKDEAASAKAKPRKSKKAADADTNGESSKGKTTSTKDTTSGDTAGPATKPKKAKKDGKKATDTANSAVEPDLAMDQGPFESLIDSAKDKPAKAPKAPKAKDTEKPKKAPKSKDEKSEKTTAPVKHKDTVKKSSAPAESSTAEPSKSKKRKASATVDTETVKADILDPLAEHASATKKQKKDLKKTVGESIGDLVNTGLEAAAHGANSLRQSFGGLKNDASKKLTDTTLEVASSLGEAKDSAKATASKAKGKGKGKGKAVADAVTSAVATPADVEGKEQDDFSDSEPDDHTAALLKGFESSGDDEPAKEGDGFKEGQLLPDLPKSKDTKKQLSAIKTTPETESGVVYLGRIPHGFYEHQMRGYFSQFGPIKRLRLSRSKKTGQSKHYAFMEFENEGVAKIVAGTMDNYLMFGHILKCKFVAKENLQEDLWKGANKRFKAVPRNKIEGRKLAVAVGKEHWKGRVEREEKKRGEMLEKTKAIGYEFIAPALRSVDQVKKAIEGEEVVEEQEKSLVTVGDGEGVGGLVVSEEVKTTKTKKGVKGVGEVATTVVKKTKRTLEDGAETAEGTVKKAKKSAMKVAA